MKIMLWVGLGASLAAFLTAFLYFYSTEHLLVVHFDFFRGIDFLGTKTHVLGIGLVSLFLNAVNLSLARFFFDRDRYIAWAFALVNLGISVLSLIAVTVIVANN